MYTLKDNEIHKPSFHDCEVKNIKFLKHKNNRCVEFELITEDEEIYQVFLGNLEALEIVEIALQNILFSIEVYDNQSTEENVLLKKLDEFGFLKFSQYFLNKSSKKYLVDFNPSVGMGLRAICEELIIKK